MKKRFLITLLIAMTTLGQLIAAPARREPVTFIQPDGTSITLQLCGDEYHHFYTTTDGTPVTRGEDGYFYYTQLDSLYNPVASTCKVGDNRTLQPDKVSVLKRHSELNIEKRQLRLNAAATRTIPIQRAKAAAAANDGEIKGLIILVNFQDKAFVTPQSTIDDMMNKEGYSDAYGTIGSARDYFNAQSYGQFKPSFDVVGPVTLSRNMSYYGGNDRSGVDQYPDVMVSEACEIASQEGLVDMSDYDLDNDGWVDLIYVIYAGHAESSGAPSNTVWPHAWYIYHGAGRSVQVDGVYLDAYACSAELTSKSGTQVDGIGTFCHEYSHTLGLPDLYDIDYSGGVGMSYWSVMDAGCYAEGGYVPTSFSAFERFYCGWLELNELDAPATIEMGDLNKDKTAAYRISSDDENQFITLETRTCQGWDMGLPAEGLMITAIDYDARVWDKNAPNDSPSRQRVKLIPADDQWDAYTLYGDLYPYGGNTSLTSTSSPAMVVYDNSITGKPITNITYNQGIVTFDFMGGGSNSTLDAPVATSAGNITGNGFTAYWSPVEGATSYDLYVERVEESTEIPAIAFEENFDGFDGSASLDVSSKLDQYTTLPGWSGHKVFCYNQMVKLGSSNSYGSLTTPPFPVATEHTVYIDLAAYDQDALSGLLTFIIEYDDKEGVCEVNMSELPYDHLMTIGISGHNKSDNCILTIECDKRLFIDNLRIENDINKSAVRQAALCIDALTGEITRNNVVNPTRAMSVEEGYTFQGITSTYYNVTKVINDVHEGTYRYKVRAVNNDGHSSWSNVIEVVISSNLPDNIAEVESDNNARIYASQGTIHIKSSTPQMAAIYTLQGTLVATLRVQDSCEYTPSVPGVYLVRCGEQVSKVVIHHARG